ncbi:MAG TPA: hypothetical protein VLH61_08650 [Bacteroidales bacterium]|nr:hypothetical protein [Bacteroidales bacterium]
MKICKKVLDRLNDRGHPARVNLEKMKNDIPEIGIMKAMKNKTSAPLRALCGGKH